MKDSKWAVFCCSDKQYQVPSLIALISFKEMNGDAFDYFLYTDVELDDYSKKLAEEVGVSVILLNPDRDFKSHGRWSEIVFYQWGVPDLLSSKYTNALKIDGDCICLKKLNLDLISPKNRVLRALQTKLIGTNSCTQKGYKYKEEVIDFLEKEHSISYQEIKKSSAVQCGVIAINLEIYKKEQVYLKFKKMYLTAPEGKRDKYFFSDQGVMSLLMVKYSLSIYPLPVSHNRTVYNGLQISAVMSGIMQSTSILHCNSFPKPWEPIDNINKFINHSPLSLVLSYRIIWADRVNKLINENERSNLFLNDVMNNVMNFEYLNYIYKVKKDVIFNDIKKLKFNKVFLQNLRTILVVARMQYLLKKHIK